MTKVAKMYRSLPPSKLEKYTRKAQELREEYAKKKLEF